MREYSLDKFGNETAISITVVCLNAQYPNVTFEASEIGDGYYELFVVSTHGFGIGKRTLAMFRDSAWIIYQSIPVIIEYLHK